LTNFSHSAVENFFRSTGISMAYPLYEVVHVGLELEGPRILCHRQDTCTFYLFQLDELC
jgi:hypothetical protein